MCAFCPRDAVKRGGEHIWDDWLNRKLPTKTYAVQTRLTPKDPFRSFAKKMLDLKLPVVCGECNSTWMSDITNDISKSFADAIINGAELSILPRGLALLSAFTFMKAVVADCVTQSNGDELFFSTAVREQFRTSLTVPATVQMWVSSFYGKRRYGGRFISGLLVPGPGPLFGIEFFVFTYVVGHLVLQLLAPRWKDVRLRGQRLPMIKPNAYWDSAVSRFWPSDGFPVKWPLKHLRDDTLQAFIDRLKAPIDVPIGGW
jgi:hypothetical protein